MAQAKLAAQLYTIRDYLQTDEDFAASMKKIAEIGYRYVQVSGIGDLDWGKMREALDANGLECLITHVSTEAILKNPEQVIENHRILGCDVIGIGSGGRMLFTEAWSMEDFGTLMGQLEEAGRIVTDAGMTFAYHNHHTEFRRLPNGEYFMDAMLARIPKELMSLTLDVYWLQYGGMALPASLERLADRVVALHLKDYRINTQNQPEFAEVGQGTLPWDEILEVADRHGITIHAVEQDTCPGDPFESLKLSYDYLKDRY